MSEKLSPFDITSNINEKKGLLDIAETGYEPYMVNRVLSNTQDSVFFANEMNTCWGLPKDMQYAFLYHGLPKKKRFGKWHKNQDDKEELAVIQEFFGYSRQKAKAVHALLKPYFGQIKAELDKGGKTKCQVPKNS